MARRFSRPQRETTMHNSLDATYAAKMAELGREPSDDAADCTCVVSCADDPDTACSLSGRPHVHPDDGTGVLGPCPVHPDAPGDL